MELSKIRRAEFSWYVGISGEDRTHGPALLRSGTAMASWFENFEKYVSG